MSIDLMKSGLKQGFHLEVENGHLNVVRDRKGCCSRRNVLQLEKEKEGITAALELFKATPTSAETAFLYSAVNQRYRHVRSLTSGFLKWLITLLSRILFLSQRRNRQLKLLQEKYREFRQAFSQKELIESIATKVLISEGSKSEAQVFAQFQQECPDLFKRGKIKQKDFNSAAFFIQKDVIGYKVIFSSKTLKFDSLSDLKWLLQPLTDLDSEIKKLSEICEIDVIRKECGGLLVNLSNPNPLVISRLSKWRQKFPIEITLTLDDRIGDLRLFYEEDRLPGWLDSIASSVRSLSIRDKKLKDLLIPKQFKKITEININCENLESLYFNNLKKLDDLHILNPKKITDLSFPGCSNLSTPNDFSIFKNLLHLDLRDCNFKKIHLGKLNKLQYLDLSGTPIEELPDLKNFPKLRGVSLNNCSGIQRISVSNVGAEFRNCSNLKELSLDKFFMGSLYIAREFKALEKFTLSKMPYEYHLDLSWFENLKEVHISGLANLRALNLSGSTLEGLSIHNTPLERLILSSCQFSDNCLDSLVTQMPQWTRLKNLNLSNCQLTNEEFEILAPALCTLPNLCTLDISRNAITQIPEIFDSRPALRNRIEQYLLQLNDFQIAKNAGDKFLFRLSREDLNNAILKLISQFSSGLSEYISDLIIVYLGESGIDAGGLSRDFIGELFTSVAKKCLSDSIISLDKTLCNFKTEENAKKLFQGIGKILAFILRTSGRYPTGKVFSLELFESLKNCASSLLNKSYDQLSVQELLSLSSVSLNKSFALTEISAFLSSATQEEASAYMEAVQGFYTKLEKQMPDPSDFDTLKSRTRKLLFKCCKDRLWPILEIAKGFSTIAPVWDARQKLKPEFMEQVIRGVSSKKLILQNLDYSLNFPDNSRKWLENWIKQAGKPKLTSFLHFTVGAKALSHGQRIFVQGVSSYVLSANTCGPQLNVPIESSCATLWAALDNLNNGEHKFGMA